MNKLLIAIALAAACSTSFADGCNTDSFTVTSKSARVNEWGETLVTVAVRNGNTIACSPKVQVSVLDKDGNLIGTKDSWVVTENYAPGVTRNVTIRLPKDLAKAGKSYSVTPTESRVWSNR